MYYDNHTAILVKEAGNNHWLLTGFENEKNVDAYAIGEVSDSSDASAAKPIPTRLDGVKASTISEDIVTPETPNSQACLIRAIRTIWQTAVALIGTNAVGVTEVDWLGVLSGAALAGVVSILTSIATGLPEA